MKFKFFYFFVVLWEDGYKQSKKGKNQWILWFFNRIVGFLKISIFLISHMINTDCMIMKSTFFIFILTSTFYVIIFLKIQMPITTLKWSAV